MYRCLIISESSLTAVGVETLIRSAVHSQAQHFKFDHLRWADLPDPSQPVITPSTVLTVCLLEKGQPFDHVASRGLTLHLSNDVPPATLKKLSPTCLVAAANIPARRFIRLVHQMMLDHLPDAFWGTERHEDKTAPTHVSQRLRDLTPRQVQILSLMHQGMSNKLIARQLGLVEGTVKIHVSKILQTLGVSSRLVLLASANTQYRSQPS